MTNNYMGMTPWEYNEWARSRETAGDYFYEPDRSIVGYPQQPSSGTGGSGGSGGSGGTGTTTPPADPYKDIDRSPFELGPNDALALAQQQRVRDATAYRHNLAGLPQPIELWSGNVADTQRTTPMGTVASLMPGTGAFADSASYRNYALARDAYMSDPIRAALAAAQPPPSSTPTIPGTNVTPNTPIYGVPDNGIQWPGPAPFTPSAPPTQYTSPPPLPTDYWRT
jgi:hypothetical protein